MSEDGKVQNNTADTQKENLKCASWEKLKEKQLRNTIL
jgi:hypothetical protein